MDFQVLMHVVVEIESCRVVIKVRHTACALSGMSVFHQHLFVSKVSLSCDIRFSVARINKWLVMVVLPSSSLVFI